MKKVCCSYWLATIFSVAYLVHPLNTTPCQPAPDWQFSNGNIVPINQVTNIVQPTMESPAQPNVEKPQVIGLLIAFGVAILVIGYIFYQIIQMLNKVIPPPKPPPPPPTAPNTNYPPVVINPKGSPGPALSDLGRTSFYTNSPSSLNCYDITSLKYENTLDKFSSPYLFDHFWSVRTEISTDLQNWEDSHYRVDCYICSSVGVCYMYYHYETNFYNSYFTSDYVATNKATAYFDFTDKPSLPKQFFRLVPE